MNLKKFFFRDEQQISVGVAELWEVRWCGVYEEYSHTSGNYKVKPHVMAFTSEKGAQEFKRALEDAYKITKNNLRLKEITIEKQKV